MLSGLGFYCRRKTAVLYRVIIAYNSKSGLPEYGGPLLFYGFTEFMI
jgi:hypothetical protein